MKRILPFILTGLLILLCGCTPKDIDISEMDEKEILVWAVDRFNTANSIEWESIRYYRSQDKEDEIVSTSHGDNKYIKKPFTQWSQFAMNQGAESRMPVETFGEEKNGELLWSIRDNNTDVEPVDVYENGKKKTTMETLIWNTSSITGEQKDAFIPYLEMKFLQLAYLLSSNIDSFVPGKDTLDETTCIKYDGHITQETVLDYYEEFGRDIYAGVGMIEKKEGMTRDDLKNEILNAATAQPYEIASGLNEILFSDNPAPVSIWVNAETGAIMNIKIDFTEAAANHTKLIDPNYQITVKENFTGYSNIIFDGIKKLKMPK